MITSALCQGRSDPSQKGTLLIMGGDCTNDLFLKEFANLAGGLEANIIIIPSAIEDELLQSEYDLKRVIQPFVKFGFKHIKIVHTRNKAIANSDSLNKLILEADGVWITGGRQWRLASAYYETKVVESLKTIVDKGKVLAGTSAGASILGSHLVRGDSANYTKIMGKYFDGFGFFKSCAIDQHHLARNRLFEMFEIKREYPEILGLGIDENTGIVMQNGRFKVIGTSFVTIYDGTRWSSERDTIYKLSKGVEQFYLLGAYQEYDIVNRKIMLSKDHKKAKGSFQALKSLEGSYQQQESLDFGNDLRMKITVEHNKLYFEQSWNDAKYEVFYDNALTFFRPKANAIFYFEKDKFGIIEAFIYYQHGHSTWKKIEN